MLVASVMGSGGRGSVRKDLNLEGGSRSLFCQAKMPKEVIKGGTPPFAPPPRRPRRVEEEGGWRTRMA